MNFFDHKDLGNHLLHLCPKVVKHPVFYSILLDRKWRSLNTVFIFLICLHRQNASCLLTAHSSSSSWLFTVQQTSVPMCFCCAQSANTFHLISSHLSPFRPVQASKHPKLSFTNWKSTINASPLSCCHTERVFPTHVCSFLVDDTGLVSILIFYYYLATVVFRVDGV